MRDAIKLHPRLPILLFERSSFANFIGKLLLRARSERLSASISFEERSRSVNSFGSEDIISFILFEPMLLLERFTFVTVFGRDLTIFTSRSNVIFFRALILRAVNCNFDNHLYSLLNLFAFSKHLPCPLRP